MCYKNLGKIYKNRVIKVKYCISSHKILKLSKGPMLCCDAHIYSG